MPLITTRVIMTKKESIGGNTKKLLLLVDVQYDFINGSLAVDGAPAVMDNLANYIAAQPKGTFDAIDEIILYIHEQQKFFRVASD